MVSDSKIRVHMLDVVPENGNIYQCHVYDNHNSLFLQASRKLCSGHRPQGIQHIPRRFPHERFDKSEMSVSHDAAPQTKNYVFDSHWQWRSNLWNRIWEKRFLADLPGENVPKARRRKRVVYVVVVKGPVRASARSSSIVDQTEKRQATESRCTDSMRPLDGLWAEYCVACT